MYPYQDTAKLGETEHAAVQHRAVAILRIGEGMVAVGPLETWVAGCFTFFHSAEERLIRRVHPAQHVLQDLRMHLPIVRARGFQVRQLRGLLIVARADTLATPHHALRCSRARL